MTEKEKRVIEMYQQGYRVRDIRDKEDMPLVNLYELLKRSKITLRGKGYRKITLGGAKEMEESKWEITTNYIDGKKLYGVYRIIDINEVDHSGNREVKGYYDSREKAEEIAEELNSMNDDTF